MLSPLQLVASHLRLLSGVAASWQGALTQRVCGSRSFSCCVAIHTSSVRYSLLDVTSGIFSCSTCTPQAAVAVASVQVYPRTGDSDTRCNSSTLSWWRAYALENSGHSDAYHGRRVVVLISNAQVAQNGGFTVDLHA